MRAAGTRRRFRWIASTRCTIRSRAVSTPERSFATSTTGYVPIARDRAERLAARAAPPRRDRRRRARPSRHRLRVGKTRCTAASTGAAADHADAVQSRTVPESSAMPAGARAARTRQATTPAARLPGRSAGAALTDRQRNRARRPIAVRVARDEHHREVSVNEPWKRTDGIRQIETADADLHKAHAVAADARLDARDVRPGDDVAEDAIARPDGRLADGDGEDSRGCRGRQSRHLFLDRSRRRAKQRRGWARRRRRDRQGRLALRARGSAARVSCRQPRSADRSGAPHGCSRRMRATGRDPNGRAQLAHFGWFCRAEVENPLVTGNSQ